MARLRTRARIDKQRGLGTDNDTSAIDSLMSSTNRTNGTDEAPSDMLARLSIEEMKNGRFGVEVQANDITHSGMIEPNGGPSHKTSNGVGSPSVPSAKGGHGEGAMNGKKAMEAMQALHVLQGSASGVSGSRKIGPSSPSRAPEGSGKASSRSGAPEEDYVEEDEDSSDMSASDEDGSWISWFCSLRGNEFFCEVDEDYIQVSFRIYFILPLSFFTMYSDTYFCRMTLI